MRRFASTILLQFLHFFAKTDQGLFWQMTAETCDRLVGLVDQVWAYLCSMAGEEDYEGSIKTLRQNIQAFPSMPFLLHDIAHELYPTNERDTINPANFVDILGLIDNKEKLRSVLAELPEDDAPRLETFLQWMLKTLLPSMRTKAQWMAKHLPQRRAGGPPKKMPGPAECRRICEEINELHGKGVLLGVAQKRIAMRKEFSLRMVQRIWAERKTD
jgi:hypothetical protein